MTRSIWDIETDFEGNLIRETTEQCAGCQQLRVITGYYLNGSPDSWSPSDLIPLCRRCESRRRNNIEAQKAKPYRWL